MQARRHLPVRTLTQIALCLLLLQALPIPSAFAQSMPLREAPIIEPGASGAAPSRAAPSPQSVVQVFQDACVLNEGESTAVTDWALAQGFEAVDPLQTGAEDLLGGVAGAVLTMPGSSGRVLLAAGEDRRCLVWAERMSGPLLRVALQKMVSGLGGKGARVQNVLDRNLQSAGVWRKQSQWRYRRPGGSEDFGVGSATTLADAPSAQLLHFAPMSPAAPRHPDGQPSR